MSLRSIMSAMESEDPNVFKIDNGDPAQGFAVNFKLALRDLLAKPEVEYAVVGIDDYGNELTSIDMSNKPKEVLLDILSCSAPLDIQGNHVSVGHILKELAIIIKDALEDPISFDLDIEPQPDLFDKLVVERLVWLADDSEWYLAFSEEAYKS